MSAATRKSLLSNIDSKTSNGNIFLISVEELIDKAMGPANQNVIHFKLVQKILHILAHHMRILKKKVYIGLDDEDSVDSKSKTNLSEDDKGEQYRPIPKSKLARPKSAKKYNSAESIETIVREPEVLGSLTCERPCVPDTMMSDLLVKKTDDNHQKIIETERLTDKIENVIKNDSSVSISQNSELEEILDGEDENEIIAENNKEKHIVSTQETQPKDLAEVTKEKSEEIATVVKEKPEDLAAVTNEISKDLTVDAEENYIDLATCSKEKQEYSAVLHEKSNDLVAVEKDKSKTEIVKEKESIASITEEDKYDEKIPLVAKEKTRKVVEMKQKREANANIISDTVSTESEELPSLTEEKSEGLLQQVKEAPPLKQKIEIRRKSSILISEKEFDNEKILVVEKGPTTYGYSGAGSRHRAGSIQVVTRSQYELLEEVVDELKEKVATVQMPKIPEDQKLVHNILNGEVSAVEVIGTMQVAARVQAAEQAVTAVADVLTEMSGKGAVPTDVVERLADITAKMPTTAEQFIAKSMAALQKAGILDVMKPEMIGGVSATAKPYSGTTLGAYSTRSHLSSRMLAGEVQSVSEIDLQDALNSLKSDLMKFITNQCKQAKSACDKAAERAKTVQEQMAIIVRLNFNINKLTSLVGDYNEELKGFGAGLNDQIMNFNEQIEGIRVDLKSGLQQMEAATSEAHKLSLQELNERYDETAAMLERLQFMQKEMKRSNIDIRDKFRNLAHYAEILHDQKADRDELMDALKNKVHVSRLKGLMTEESFHKEQMAIMKSLDNCYLKFHRQEEVWMTAIKDLAQLLNEKADIKELTRTQLASEKQLQELQKLVAKLAIRLGEPEAAILTRKISKNGVCGPCRTPAVQRADESKHSPIKLPAARPTPIGEDKPCKPTFDVKGFLPKLMQEDRPKTHLCNRWVGGSHTVVNETVKQVRTPRLVFTTPPVRKYLDYGTDGKSYKVEEELQPRLECHVCRPDSSNLPQAKAKDKRTGGLEATSIDSDRNEVTSMYTDGQIYSSMDKDGQIDLSLHKDEQNNFSIDGDRQIDFSMDKEVEEEQCYDLIPEDFKTDEITNLSTMAVKSVVFDDYEGALDVDSEIE